MARWLPVLTVVLAGAGLLDGSWAEAAQSAAPDPTETLTLQRFGETQAKCLEWNDGCATCRRETAAAGAHCSTPGIACQAGPIVCACEAP